MESSLDAEDRQDNITRRDARSSTIGDNILSQHTNQLAEVAITSVVALLMCTLSSTAVQAASREKFLEVKVTGRGRDQLYSRHQLPGPLYRILQKEAKARKPGSLSRL